MDLALTGRVALVTGASAGIGRAVATALADEGASLVVCAREPERLHAVAAELEQREVPVVAVACDVTDPGSAAMLLSAGESSFGQIDILVNNAGSPEAKRLDTVTDEDWRTAFEGNFLSAARLAQACLPGMRSRGWGRIVNVASTSARMPDPWYAPYAAAKAALVNVTRTLAAAYSSDGVLTTCVLPGVTQTPGVESRAAAAAAASGRSIDDVLAATTARAPIAMGRLGQPREVAAAVVFLASQAAAWVTGACLAVDGGTLPVVP